MKKFLIVLLTICGLFVSCATSKVEEIPEGAGHFKYLTNIRSSELYVVDDSSLRELFNEFNAELFNNELTVDYIGFVRPSKIYGKDGLPRNGYAMWYTRNRNGVSNTTYGIVLVPNYSKGVLIHEMVHLYFYQNKMLYEDHGKNFCKMVDDLNKKTNYKYNIPKN